MQTRETASLHNAQKIIYSHMRMHPESKKYHHAVALEMQGTLNKAALRESVWLLLQKHPMLRSCIQLDAEQNPYFQINTLKEAWKESLLSDTIVEIKMKSLEFSKLCATPPHSILNAELPLEKSLFKLFIIPTSNQSSAPKCYLVVLLHHIIMDETSLDILLRDLAAFYNSALQPSKVTPADYAWPQNCSELLALREDEMSHRKNFWKESMQNHTLLSPSMPNLSHKTSDDRVIFEFSKESVQIIKQAALELQVSVNVFFISALYVLLRQYQQQKDITIGITSANRRLADLHKNALDHVVSCFFNSIPLRIHPEASTSSFANITALCQTVQKAALTHQLPLDELIDTLQKTQQEQGNNETAHAPFQVMLVFKEKKMQLNFEGLNISEPREINFKQCKFEWFGFSIIEKHDGTFSGFMDYSGQKLNNKLAKRIILQFQSIVLQACRNHHLLVDQFNILQNNDYEAIQLCNQFALNTSKNISVIEQLRNEATEHPNHHIVKTIHAPLNASNDEGLTYAELEQQSEQLAKFICAQSYPKDYAIGISITRSTLLIVAIFAVIKSGHAFIPLEHESSEKLNAKLQDKKLACVLTDLHTFNILSSHVPSTLKIINISSMRNLLVTILEQPITLPTVLETDPVYKIYTSGSTMKPKGVVIPHMGLNNLLHAMKHQNIHQTPNILGTAPATFDAFYYDLVVALATTGTVYLIDDAIRQNAQALNDVCVKHQISFAAVLPDIASYIEPTPYLKHLIVMGSFPKSSVMKKLLSDGRRVENGCGRTEATICDTMYRITQVNGGSIPIGKPIHGISQYVVNPDTLQICPLGVMGEVLLAGPGLALGYDNPDLNEKKFPSYYLNLQEGRLEIPTRSDQPLTRFYRTGDIGYLELDEYSHEPVLSLRGRVDFQLKILGVRIELEGITAAIKKHDEVANAIVINSGTNENPSLLAYVLFLPHSTLSQTLDNNKIRIAIIEHLKQLGINPAGFPKMILSVSTWAINQNGKPDLATIESHVKPDQYTVTLKTEELSPFMLKIVTLWANMFGYGKPDHIAPLLNFSQLGGSSLQWLGFTANFKKLAGEYGIDYSSFSINMNSSLELILQQAMQLSYTPGVFQSTALLYHRTPVTTAQNVTTIASQQKSVNLSTTNFN